MNEHSFLSPSNVKPPLAAAWVVSAAGEGVNAAGQGRDERASRGPVRGGLTDQRRVNEHSFPPAEPPGSTLAGEPSRSTESARAVPGDETHGKSG